VKWLESSLSVIPEYPTISDRIKSVPSLELPYPIPSADSVRFRMGFDQGGKSFLVNRGRTNLRARGMLGGLVGCRFV